MSEVLFVLSILFIMYIFTMIASDVYLTKAGNKLSDIGIRGLTTLGILLIIIAVIMPFMVRGYYKSRIENYVNIANLGAVGDFIGGTTVAFLTAASVVLLLATIIMQRKEIKISQQGIVELVKQTEASVKQAEEARKETQITNETMKQQQFEATFFNMLSLHHQIVNNIKFSELKKTYTGREAIGKLKDIYEEKFIKKQYILENPEKGLANLRDYRIKNELLEKLFGNSDTINQEALNEVYKEFHDEYGNSIGHYMRNNYRIVKFIVNNVADDKTEQKSMKKETGREPIIGDKRYYFGTLRAQWSNAEFELILINSLYKENHKFKNLILKYDVLDIKESEKNELDKQTPLEGFILKDSMSRFKAYRKLIETN
ncbi:putative phage abortive infection protein [Peribacillus simplex]|uniref:putative phage abortive infection protein n=1 Tax=Peribacillus simplex TaxID=1478 RepID=UPI003D2653A2